MDRFDSMSAFVAVVEEGGFSAASRKLGMPLATISRKSLRPRGIAAGEPLQSIDTKGDPDR